MNKPSFLIALDARNAAAIEKSTRATLERRAGYARNAARYARATFWRGSRDIADFFKGGRVDFSTLQDAENDCRDACDFSYYFAPDMRREAWREHGDDARALFEFLAPGAPFERYADDVETDLVRALADAASADYSLQFFHWCREAVEDCANASGLEWAWLDANGAPTVEEYDARAVGFACSRRAFLNSGAEWWPEKWWQKGETTWTDYASNRERMDAADEVLDEHLRAVFEDHAADVGHFDERGGRYADTDFWPDLFRDYSEAVDAATRDARDLRARLAGMIRNRAPLEHRAALVDAFRAGGAA